MNYVCAVYGAKPSQASPIGSLVKACISVQLICVTVPKVSTSVLFISSEFITFALGLAFFDAHKKAMLFSWLCPYHQFVQFVSTIQGVC